MALLRVDTRPLVPRLRAELAALLAGLSGGDWAHPTACPCWDVHAVAAHLLGVELGNVSVRRDGWGLGPARGEDPDAWLNAFNQQWVDAARRISPALLAEFLNLAGLRFEEHLATPDLDATGGPVEWATGSDPAPVWLGAVFTGPVLATAAHALPRALDQVTRPVGTVVAFTARGEGGGTWHVVRSSAGWELSPAQPALPRATHAPPWTARSSSTFGTQARHR
jgi:hypothetical protein